MHQNQNKNKHIPVLLSEVIQYLEPKEEASYLDLTAGYGGHAEAVIGRTKAPEKVVLVDRDKEAVEYLQQKFDGTSVKIIHQDFLEASRKINEAGLKFELILADLGVSSPHITQASRGFSIQSDGPLDMRMDSSQELTAEVIVNNYTEEALTDIIRRYGEEPKARSIARTIVGNRPIGSTAQLASMVPRAVKPRGRPKIHPATRTFQAIRIAVNNELQQLDQALPVWLELLEPGGRLAVISFHSLEDRIVKQFFKEHSNGYEADLQLLTKKPVGPSHTEIVFNPRSRSAKLRVAVKK